MIQRHKSSTQHAVLLGGLVYAFFTVRPKGWINANNIGVQLRDSPGAGGCILYDENTLTFFLECSFNWTDYYDADFITLEANELFQGQHHTIFLDGVIGWKGLFKINASSLVDAPNITQLHIREGETG